MGQLTTHVLDTHLGKPAQGLVIELWALLEWPRLLKSVTTNVDGRVDEPLLEGLSFVTGTYEIRFLAADYLRKTGATLAAPPFLDVIPIRFSIASIAEHYHVPLLLSAHGYSTYRGS